MINKKNVLIFPAGSEDAINIYNALKYNIHFELFGASMVSNHAEFLYDKNHYFEGDLRITSESFFNTINSVIEKFKIDYILCNHDEVAPFMIKNQNKVNAIICTSPYETSKIAENKLLTAKTFKNKYYMPEIYTPESIKKYPIFAKPYVSAGGKGAKIVNSKEELDSILSNRSDMLLCEYLPGEEYTIDCFTNKNGELLFAHARTRGRVTNGITYRCEKVDDNKIFEEIANDINKTLTFRGAWFFQLKKDAKGNLKLLEICIRQAGTMVYFRQYGINFPALTLFDFMGENVEPLFNNFDLTLDRCIHNSYKLKYEYENVYFDFDDTIIVKNKVNTNAMRFIYQCINKNKNLYLLSRHAKDINDSLKKWRIDKNIFNKIIIIPDDKKKSDFIVGEKSILIDNYFRERKEVQQNCNIPVFDVDAIDCLIDDSEL